MYSSWYRNKKTAVHTYVHLLCKCGIKELVHLHLKVTEIYITIKINDIKSTFVLKIKISINFSYKGE